jgi:hypothetical protein
MMQLTVSDPSPARQGAFVGKVRSEVTKTPRVSTGSELPRSMLRPKQRLSHRRALGSRPLVQSRLELRLVT